MTNLAHERSWGSLSLEQSNCVEKHVRGEVVYDIGCGPLLHLSYELRGMDPKKVVAIDTKEFPQRYYQGGKSPAMWPHSAVPAINWVEGLPPLYIVRGTATEDNVEKDQVLFFSWPIFFSETYDSLLPSAKKVIYLGQNWGGTSCGSSRFWDELRKREVLDLIPERSNTLIVYGRHLTDAELKDRSYIPEEHAIDKVFDRFEDMYPEGWKEL